MPITAAINIINIFIIFTTFPIEAVKFSAVERADGGKREKRAMLATLQLF